MTRLLVSARDADEAFAAVRAGADLIDLKDPSRGALGGLEPAHIEQITAALRAEHPTVPVSATIGDVPAHEVTAILRRVEAVAACAVDYVKVGIPPGQGAAALLRALRVCAAPVVPVLLADEGIDFSLVHEATCGESFPALMLDTEDKRGGRLLQRVAAESLARFIKEVRHSGRLAGLAGALRAEDVQSLLILAPDIAGFRSAVCAGHRAGPLEPARVRELHLRFAAHALPAGDVIVRR
jgi:uncharacterized protein (UPF0264 family)